MKYTQRLKLFLATVAKSICVAQFKDVPGLLRGNPCVNVKNKSTNQLQRTLISALIKVLLPR